MDKKFTRPLQLQLAAIERELAELPFDAAKQRLAAAESAMAQHARANDLLVTVAATKASGELKHARQALAALHARAATLGRYADALRYSLASEERVEASEAAVAEAEHAARQAEAALAAAGESVAKLAALLDDEIRSDADAAEAEGAAMLQAVKAGADVLQAAQTRTSKAPSLRIALANAERERDAARIQKEAALAAVKARRAEAAGAKADVAEVIYRVEEEAFIAAAGRLMAARVRANRPGLFFGPEMHARAMQALEAELQREA